MSQGQIKNRFDWKSIKKIGKSILLASAGSGALVLIGYLQKINYGSLAPLAVAGFPILINAIREFMKGDDA